MNTLTSDHILLTGFPGFLGSELLLRSLQKGSDRFSCLVQGKFRPLAEQKLESWTGKHPEVRDRVRLIEGDITQAGLGITVSDGLSDVSRVQHFAAVYDLNVKKEIAQRINVEGTQNILRFCEGLPRLSRLDYVSTCYVSGKYEGVFKEDDLDQAKVFNNHYESTKHEAEKSVRLAMKNGLPATILRPAIVVGNSRTGETDKFDGPYFVMQWLLRQGNHALLPRLGDPDRYTINLVPSDFVVEAIAALCADPSAAGKTFQLAHPAPLTIGETVRVIAEACGKRLIEIPLPKWLAKSAVGGIPGLERWLGIPRSSLDYFVHPTSYDTTNATAHLQKLGIHCPRFDEYAFRLVEFMKKHPEIRKQAMI
jgi:thioester reductase-like protein